MKLQEWMNVYEINGVGYLGECRYQELFLMGTWDLCVCVGW